MNRSQARLVIKTIVTSPPGDVNHSMKHLENIAAWNDDSLVQIRQAAVSELSIPQFLEHDCLRLLLAFCEYCKSISISDRDRGRIESIIDAFLDIYEFNTGIECDFYANETLPAHEDSFYEDDNRKIKQSFGYLSTTDVTIVN